MKPQQENSNKGGSRHVRVVFLDTFRLTKGLGKKNWFGKRKDDDWSKLSYHIMSFCSFSHSSETRLDIEYKELQFPFILMLSCEVENNIGGDRLANHAVLHIMPCTALSILSCTYKQQHTTAQ